MDVNPVSQFIPPPRPLPGSSLVATRGNASRSLLVVGGIDRLTRIDSAQKLLDRLAALGEQQTVITADVNGTFPDAHVRDVIEVHNLTDNEFVQLETEDRV